MALKDWEKVGKDSWKKKNDSVEIITDFNKNMKIEGYEVGIYVFDSHHINKNFKSKSQAITFARNYMRTH